MIAGRLKYRIEMLEPVKVKTSTGAEREGYQSRGVAYAERLKITSRLSIEIGERFPDATVLYNIRDAHPVDELWRVRDIATGKLYSVIGAEPNRDRGFKTLICDRVNE